MRPQTPLGRSAGLVVPLFSLHSTRGAGIGDIGDLAALAPWLREAGLSALQLLPATNRKTIRKRPVREIRFIP